MAQQKRPNMQQMLQQVQKMQREMEEAQEALKHETVEAHGGRGRGEGAGLGRPAGQVGDDRPRGGRPRGRGDARRPRAARRSTRRCAPPRSWRRERMGGATGGLDLGALGGLGLPGL